MVNDDEDQVEKAGKELKMTRWLRSRDGGVCKCFCLRGCHCDKADHVTVASSTVCV